MSIFGVLLKLKDRQWRKKHKVFVILLYVVLLSCATMIVWSLFIPPYWHVDRSVWKAYGMLMCSVLCYGGYVLVMEAMSSEENVDFHFRDWSIHTKGKTKSHSKST